MVATNIKIRTGNVSAGTSVFAMVVMDEPLSRVHPEIDLVTTPSSAPVAMVHCNNCTSDLNAWVSLFRQVLSCLDVPQLRRALRNFIPQSTGSAPDCDSLMAYNYFSVSMSPGLNRDVRCLSAVGKRLYLANFMRTHLYTSLGALKTGLDILMRRGRNVRQRHRPRQFIQNPGRGAAHFGRCHEYLSPAWKPPARPLGMAILAAYMMKSAENPSLEKYLADSVFACSQSTTVSPEQADVDGFNAFMQRYAKGLSVEKAAVDCL
ncbi:MAG: FGGY-family carbohydrate kinase [Christensenellales bacterium]